MSVVAPVRLDPRINPYRNDLAGAHLRSRVDSSRFAEGTRRRVAAPFLTVTGHPDEGARTTTQLLFGELVTVFDEADGWAWLQNDSDGYVGYAPAASLGEPGPQPTHRVGALRSFVFPAPDLKTQPLMALSFWSAVSVEGEENGWARLASGGWIYGKHLSPEQCELDHPATALRFLGTPYLWGGRTSLGLDCSALVQLSLAAAGIACARDSDLQRAALGEPAPNEGPYRRGDLIFFPGHVGIMVDGVRMVHANAFHMMVTAEPVAEIVGRAGGNAGISAVRRLNL